MDAEQKAALIREVGGLRYGRIRRLNALGIPCSTFYAWKRRYEREGIMGLEKKVSKGRVWNRLTGYERERVVEVARLHPELSCRLIAVKIMDEEDFSVSPSTVYRLLKQEGLVAPRPLTDLPAARSWRHKTKEPDEIWQCDATHYFVVGWGFYKLITVQDDYSRNPLAWEVKPDETAFSISDVVEEAIESAREQGHLQNGHRPKLLSDNGSGFTSKVLAEYLTAHGIQHIFGKPYHPQTQGKIERFQRSIKERVCLLVYCSPGELKKATDETIAAYSQTPHTSLSNVSPENTYAGRREEILQKRARKKCLTLERRRVCNLSGEGQQ